MYILGLGRYLGDWHDGMSRCEVPGQPLLSRDLLHPLGMYPKCGYRQRM